MIKADAFQGFSDVEIFYGPERIDNLSLIQ